jgi:hypothetical protein
VIEVTVPFTIVAVAVAPLPFPPAIKTEGATTNPLPPFKTGIETNLPLAFIIGVPNITLSAIAGPVTGSETSSLYMYRS